jgi:hypothetical protein
MYIGVPGLGVSNALKIISRSLVCDLWYWWLQLQEGFEEDVEEIDGDHEN